VGFAELANREGVCLLDLISAECEGEQQTHGAGSGVNCLVRRLQG
jgi:hypothetical protein